MSDINKENAENAVIMPLVAVHQGVVFPETVTIFDMVRGKATETVEYAMRKDLPVFFVCQKGEFVEDPTLDDLYKIGTISRVKQVINISSNAIRVVVLGEYRAVLVNMLSCEPYITAQIERLPEEKTTASKEQVEAYVKTGCEWFEEFSSISGKISPDVIKEVLKCDSLGKMADFIGNYIAASFSEKQEILVCLNENIRVELAMEILQREIRILQLQKEIVLKAKQAMDKIQREFFLKEQLKVIKSELGETDSLEEEIEGYRSQALLSKTPAYVMEKLEKEFKRLGHSSNFSAESGVIRDYIQLLLAMPWNKKTKDKSDLKKTQDILNKDHYGLEKIKERIIELLATRQMSSEANPTIICLVGPPGVGKTSIAKSISHALGRQYARISLGGMKDEAEIRGHRRTYIGAMPGRIINAVKLAKTSNPLILLDELDKTGANYKGNISDALLEVLDSEQNKTFRDHYLELDFDLSDVLFICTANSIENVPSALKDRLEIITLSTYTQDEKKNIALKYLVEKQMKKHGLKKSNFKVEEAVIDSIIRNYTREAGVRQLERCIAKLCRKAVKDIVMGKAKKITVTTENIQEYLGTKKYRVELKASKPEIGLARGLAWTSVGGDTLSIEANAMPGGGKLKLTGNMGDVMKESAYAAMTYIRSNCKELNIPKDFYKNTDIHIHIPEGAVPKDGPSAGITMATAMISALTSKAVSNTVAMTGEITIRGRVLPIGGLQEKLLAAKSAGLETVILPLDNERNLIDLPEYVKTDLEFVLVGAMKEVLLHALRP